MPSLTITRLMTDVAIVKLFLGPSVPRAEALAAAGRPPVYPIEVASLVDTGASTTCIDKSVAEQLGLIVTAYLDLKTVSSGDVLIPAARYEVQILFPWGPPFLIASEIPVVATELAHLGVRALLSRDVLSRCVLIWNGPEDSLTVCF
jgi:hypothetical protein